jgi:hypothetical protein
MAEVCPLALLPLLTWRELEARVCGATKIDTKLLRSITKYDGQYSREGERHPVIPLISPGRRSHSCAWRSFYLGILHMI